MSMTPETRARELYHKLDDPTLTSGESVGLIFKAITQAEDEALERAAVLFDEKHDDAWGCPSEQYAFKTAAETARSLKSQETGE
jgi:hypothetical protein